MSQDYVLHPFTPPVELSIDYARELNEQQHAAVTAVPGPALVIAGAGSGKTRTLTYRVAYLLEQGIPADRGTFHAIGNRILRRHAELLGYAKDFSILDRDDARDLVKACLDESKIDTKATRFPKPDVLLEIFSLASNTHREIPEILEAQYGYFTALEEQISKLAKAYVARKRAANSMDFDDLLALWLKLLQDHTEVRELYQRRFQFILVDEYQDTNK